MSLFAHRWNGDELWERGGQLGTNPIVELPGKRGFRKVQDRICRKPDLSGTVFWENIRVSLRCYDGEGCEH